MEYANKEVPEEIRDQESSAFNYQEIIKTAILYWKWFLLSVIVCLCVAAGYLRYATPIYQASAKLLIKDEGSGSNSRGRSSNSIAQAANLGLMVTSDGFDNEMEILSSRLLAELVVKDLKLYTTYYMKNKIKSVIAYHTNPVTVDMAEEQLEALSGPIKLTIRYEDGKYNVSGTYEYVPAEGEKATELDISTAVSALPAKISTKIGTLSITRNNRQQMRNGDVIKVVMVSPRMMSYKYQKALNVASVSKTTSIAKLTLNDEVPKRAADYLCQLARIYNRQANEDKNEVARRTEEFINGRLEKITSELGETEGSLETYKKHNQIVDISQNMTQAIQTASEYQQKLAEAQIQTELIKGLAETMNANKDYSVLPVNVGIKDVAVNTIIERYNEIALKRNSLLISASESSPSITPLTSQLKELQLNIRAAMAQAKANAELQRNKIAEELRKYSGKMTEAPEQERILTQIGRQQEVKSALYVMLLQKREENSISLAATADKGKLIDTPELSAKLSPKNSLVMLMALIIGLGVPAAILFVMQLLRYKIESHEDVKKLTKLPIIADVVVASDMTKAKANIVVHENSNTVMEEIFRSMRTNLQFIMKPTEKVILFTSTIPGEGKTFNTANLSISFALLGKKVLLVGLDIRKPQLAKLFEINDNQHGITNLLVKEKPTWEEISKQILPSDANDNLELLMAGPIPPNPAELVARNSLEIIMEELKKHYDYIIIDTAPVGLVSDTLQIGRVADTTVYVCRADYTPKEIFKLINELSESKKLPNMTVVLNGIDMSKAKHSYNYGVGKYRSYSHYGSYSTYGNYTNSHYANQNDNSVKR